MPGTADFTRVLIANRGEIALRAVRTGQKLGMESVAVYSTADAASPHVWAATRSVCIGPPSAKHSYLSIPGLLHVAEMTGCDAVYPGYGFLAENAEFAEACLNHNLKFIGPSSDAIRTMGDKARARETAQSFGVPVVPGSSKAFLDVGEAGEAAKDVGFPMLIKARSGGGGRGMRIVENPSDFDSAFGQASREAEAAFSDGALYLERFFASVRHIEVQVLGDGKGKALVFDERDCSVQRRHQKLIEESPSPAIREETRRQMLEASRRLTQGIGYEGAGTLEFILDAESQAFYFIEMNTRIQVEHTITEVRTGTDLVEAQFDIASGHPLPEIDYSAIPGGHAIEFRINAEDWCNDFQPVPGRLEKWQVPKGAGIRMDSAVYQGQQVSPFYDSMIAKLIVHGRNREDAIAKSRDALRCFDYKGLTTTIDFHRMMIDRQEFRDASVHTRWIDTDLSDESRREALK